MLGQSTGFSNQGDASMKTPPHRREMESLRVAWTHWQCLNESPSKKEGKFQGYSTERATVKVPQ